MAPGENCRFGRRCRFAHAESEQQPPPPAAAFHSVQWSCVDLARLTAVAVSSIATSWDTVMRLSRQEGGPTPVLRRMSPGDAWALWLRISREPGEAAPRHRIPHWLPELCRRLRGCRTHAVTSTRLLCTQGVSPREPCIGGRWCRHGFHHRSDAICAQDAETGACTCASEKEVGERRAAAEAQLRAVAAQIAAAAELDRKLQWALLSRREALRARVRSCVRKIHLSELGARHARSAPAPARRSSPALPAVSQAGSGPPSPPQPVGWPWRVCVRSRLPAYGVAAAARLVCAFLGRHLGWAATRRALRALKVAVGPELRAIGDDSTWRMLVASGVPWRSGGTMAGRCRLWLRRVAAVHATWADERRAGAQRHVTPWEAVDGVPPARSSQLRSANRAAVAACPMAWAEFVESGAWRGGVSMREFVDGSAKWAAMRWVVARMGEGAAEEAEEVVDWWVQLPVGVRSDGYEGAEGGSDSLALPSLPLSHAVEHTAEARRWVELGAGGRCTWGEWLLRPRDRERYYQSGASAQIPFAEFLKEAEEGWDRPAASRGTSGTCVGADEGGGSGGGSVEAVRLWELPPHASVSMATVDGRVTRVCSGVGTGGRVVEVCESEEEAGVWPRLVAVANGRAPASADVVQDAVAAGIVGGWALQRARERWEEAQAAQAAMTAAGEKRSKDAEEAGGGREGAASEVAESGGVAEGGGGGGCGGEEAVYEPLVYGDGLAGTGRWWWPGRAASGGDGDGWSDSGSDDGSESEGGSDGGSDGSSDSDSSDSGDSWVTVGDDRVAGRGEGRSRGGGLAATAVVRVSRYRRHVSTAATLSAPAAHVDGACDQLPAAAAAARQIGRELGTRAYARVDAGCVAIVCHGDHSERLPAALVRAGVVGKRRHVHV